MYLRVPSPPIFQYYTEVSLKISCIASVVYMHCVSYILSFNNEMAVTVYM